MPDYISFERKQELCRLLASNLPTLRTKSNISQNELADRLGFTRQTFSAIEGQKRDMQWSTFAAIAMFLSKDYEVNHMMSILGILDDDVRNTLRIL
jgi:DNA-binding XRE family transcriptional regulator